MVKRLRVRVPATTANLGAGFDCLGMALDIYNLFEFEVGRDTFFASGEGAEALSRDRGELVRRSWQAAFERAGREAPVVGLRLQNSIPLRRGLGSSATAVVAGLFAANYLGDLGLTEEELLVLASELEGHPDNVAPALLGGLVVAAGGSAVDYITLSPPRELRLVVAIPSFELSTARARQVLPKTVSHQDAVFNLSRAALFVAACVQKRWDLLDKAMQDRLHQPFRAPLVPGLEDVLNAAREAGAVGVALSGAGPSVLAFATHGATTIGQAMQQAFRAKGIECRILLTTPSQRGAHAVTETVTTGWIEYSGQKDHPPGTDT